jgi:hypothetical protein
MNRNHLQLISVLVLSSQPRRWLRRIRGLAHHENRAGTEETTVPAANLEQLRKAAQSPIASLISVPLQPTWKPGIGPADRIQNGMLVQPVIPISVSENWNLIIRWITLIVFQPVAVPQSLGPPLQNVGVSGLGDMNPSFFFSPKRSKIIWGIGRTFVLPTATKTTYLDRENSALDLP